MANIGYVDLAYADSYVASHFLSKSPNDFILSKFLYVAVS